MTDTVSGQVVHFVYDGDGNRILRIGPEGTTVYIGDHYERWGRRSPNTTTPLASG